MEYFSTTSFYQRARKQRENAGSLPLEMLPSTLTYVILCVFFVPFGRYTSPAESTMYFLPARLENYSQKLRP